MEFRQLEIFLKLTKTKSFSKAACELFISQPTVSTNINQLEKELETTLIIRDNKSFMLTEEGKLLKEYANSLMTMRDNAINSVKKKNKYCMPIYSSTIPLRYYIPDIIDFFLNKGLTFNLIHKDSYEVIKSIEKGLCNTGFVGSKIDANNSKLNYIEIMQDELVIAMPNNEEYMKIQGIPISNILSKPFLMREESSGTYRRGHEFLKTLPQSEKLNIIARIQDDITIIDLIKKGKGISILSRRSISNEIGKKIILYNTKNPIKRSIYFVYSNKIKHKSYEKELIDYVKSTTAKNAKKTSGKS